jgi:glycosyltransferase involved in cell wall biosynthesis
LHTLAVRLQTPVSQRIESALFRRSKQITVVAGWVAEALAAYDLDPAQIVVTGNGVEPSFLEALPDAVRQPYALYVGRLEPGKGLEDLVAAAAIYHTRCPESPLRFFIVGAGSQLESMKAQAQNAGVAHRFEFRGQIGADRRAELRELYRRAAIFVLPSHHEGMPTVLLEAMACGAPALATAVGGALEVIEHGTNGWLVPAGNPEKLADGLQMLAFDVDRSRQLGVQARATITQHFSWESVGERYLATYRRLLDRKD